MHSKSLKTLLCVSALATNGYAQFTGPGRYIIRTANSHLDQPLGWSLSSYGRVDNEAVSASTNADRDANSKWVTTVFPSKWDGEWDIEWGTTAGKYIIKTTDKFDNKNGGTQPAGWALVSTKMTDTAKSTLSNRIITHSTLITEWSIEPTTRTSGAFTIKDEANWGLASWRDNEYTNFPSKRNSGSTWVYNHEGDVYLMDWKFERVDKEYSSMNFQEMADTDYTNDNFEFLKTHGCNCPAIYGEFAVGGKSNAADTSADEVCQTFRTCMRCAKKDTACENDDMDTVNFIWLGEKGEDAQCGANTGCAALKCACHVDFMNAVSEHKNTTAVPGTDETCDPRPGTLDGCCSVGGEWKLFNTASHKCEAGELSSLCQANTIPGGSGCVPCPNGQNSKPGQSTCTSCTAAPAGTGFVGTAWDPQTGSCTNGDGTCPADYKPNSNNNGCQECPNGENSLAGQTECTKCATGSTWNPKTGTCSTGLNDILNGGKDWKKNSLGFYVHVSDTRMTWNAARTYCQGLGAGAEMAMPENADENRIFLDSIKAKQTSATDFGWWGYKRFTASDTRTWNGADGRQMKWSSWCSGEPNNSGGNERCAMTWGGNTCWNDINCGNTYRAICVYYE